MHSKTTKPPDMPHNEPAKAPGMPLEADIGSGEKTPGQVETEHLIAQIPPLPKDEKKPG